jgi:cysteine-rich repeat protein
MSRRTGKQGDINDKDNTKEFKINEGSFLLTLIVSAVLVIFSVNLVSSDVISINSGGSEQIIINPDTNIEGFFTGDVYNPVCGNGVIDTGTGETCDDGNTVSGDGCSAICATETTGGTGGTGGAGGGGGGGAVTTTGITVTPTQFTVSLAVNTNIQDIITITNSGASATTITVSQSMFDGNSNPVDMILINTTAFILNASQTMQLPVTFIAGKDTGIFTGNIRIGGVLIPVSINVKTALLLFDSNIVVLNKDYIVVKGDDLLTRVNLIPLGDKERLDVTLDYTIRDYTGKIYLTQKETLLIQNRIDFDRNFGTGNLPIGKYVVGLELKYPGGVAPSSAHFEVVTRTPITFGTIVLWLVIFIIILAMIIIIIIIYRRRKKERREE